MEFEEANASCASEHPREVPLDVVPASWEGPATKGRHATNAQPCGSLAFRDRDGRLTRRGSRTAFAGRSIVASRAEARRRYRHSVAQFWLTQSSAFFTAAWHAAVMSGRHVVVAQFKGSAPLARQ